MASTLGFPIASSSPPPPSLTVSLRFAFQVVLSRSPSPEEEQYLTQLVEQRWKQFEANSKSTETLVSGASSVYTPEHKNRAELAAWFYIANILLNLDETVTKG